MKKIAILMTAAVLLLSTGLFAFGNTDVNEKIKSSFSKNFATAKEVDWQKKDDVYFASFTFNNVKTEAAFNEEGELVATSRKIETAQLPLALSLALNEKYAGYKIASGIMETTYEN